MSPPQRTSGPTAVQVREALRKRATPQRALGAARFFKTGPGEYGEGDRFIGVTVPDQRRTAREFRTLPLAQTDRLLTSDVHEERATALLILVMQFNGARDESVRKRIYQYYLRRRKYVNNWDLVDSSADPIVGGWLWDRPREVLDRLAVSRDLWSRRIAVLATFHFIKRGVAADTVRIAAVLLEDRHDLIHKAVGWMLREVGKRVDPQVLREFLRLHAGRMPRTMLRYAIERLPPPERRKWLAVERLTSR